jgi:hypothetical protein
VDLLALFDSLDLPAWAYLPAAIVISVGSILIERSRIADPVKRVATALREGFVSRERIRAVTIEVLGHTHLRPVFSAWLATTLADLVDRVPNFFSLEEVDRIGVIANVFSKLPEKKAIELTAIPSDVAKHAFVRKRVAKAILATPYYRAKLQEGHEGL